MKYTWVLYDVSDDKGRRKLARLCQQYGLYRVQQSIFMGKSIKLKVKVFREEAAAFVNPNSDRVFILQTNEKAVHKMLTIGYRPVLDIPGSILFF